ncbi:MAG: DUF6395 domain-containing protein [Acidimicrobiia bacterium]|nr:MAG: DUF6395 domain-containing protein [Acidimicrobiia bacterium]
MRAGFRHQGDHAVFRLDLLPGEATAAVGQYDMRIALTTGQFRVELPRRVDEPHPDVAALSALTAARPWTARTLRLDRGVSAHFAGTVEAALGISVEPIDPMLPRRERGSRTALLYSGGPDSLTAETLLGPGLAFIHMTRAKHPRVPNRATHHRDDIARDLARQAAGRGEEVHFIRSDVEFVCSRPHPTFPHAMTWALGPLLLADDLDLGGVVYGLDLSHMYVGRGFRWRPFAAEDDRWVRVFAAVGLEMLLPVAGVSEVITTRLGARHRLSDLSRSCTLGDRRGPCLGCVKCARKELLKAAVEARPMTVEALDRLAASPRVVEFLSRTPVQNQHTFEYGLARVPGLEGSVFQPLRDALRPTVEDTLWLEAIYGPALNLLPAEEAARLVARAAAEGVRFMTHDEEARVESWVARSGAAGSARNLTPAG